MIQPFRGMINSHRHFKDMTQIVTQAFPVDTPVMTRLVKRDSKGRVAEAQWRGQKVIIKEIYARDQVWAINQLRKEHDRLRALFPCDNLHFAACLDLSAKHGLVILPFVPGVRIDEAMYDAPADERTKIVAAAARWLARSMEGGRETGNFSPDYWIDVLRKEIAAAILAPEDDTLLQDMMAHLARLAPPLRGGAVPRGPIHGDFSSQNIYWDAATQQLHVFDVQDHYVAPIAQDLSRLLCDLSFKRLRDEPDITLERGLCAQMRQTVMTTPALKHPDNPGSYMDFTIGYRQSVFLLGKLNHHLGFYARHAMRHWLETVPCP